ncbi:MULTISPECIES: DUF1292 domain-containing protein [unclassified Breznakia]|uniref:DUF1292 domain-containing protein n=1 Tax=unclassified Breznakia TaxID=2623764 RepID=UPI002474C130|nr:MULTISPECIES: DUF1292 domain-containing protein [unclassified Breznakia]MDH6367711.1 uncharacterized protein YrzB (UPF0473 family) [Breznakia sp. PH1-1]MDH6404799.1 uncharacterized protein YrzB (UPF0473 family) [Breznakia sp. PF1-11]MDH6412494.1 uncharacterized protein YrzB (UPF0473 family) [Breznakia sp. PFB1-11]MDH6414854.1 uncharacterized protein YrzB (UPF0473 family) [Breznakia sp. PFB1-14]MDH6417165.1 uncharacterized protein YrzB (UPF0473 family) [Breznakia sp. PFB1-4]
MESNTMFIQDENGNEKEMRILFTFENGDKKYVVFQDMQPVDDELFASAYDEDGSLLPVETDEEWEMIEEVILAFTEDTEGV